MHATRMPLPEFRNEPLVAGVLGSADAGVLGPMVENQPGLTVQVRRQRFIIASDPAVEHWSNEAGEGWHWNALNSAVRPSSWQEAQHATQCRRVSPSMAIGWSCTTTCWHAAAVLLRAPRRHLLQQLAAVTRCGGPDAVGRSGSLGIDPRPRVRHSWPFAVRRDPQPGALLGRWLWGEDSVDTVGGGPLPPTTGHGGSGAASALSSATSASLCRRRVGHRRSPSAVGGIRVSSSALRPPRVSSRSLDDGPDDGVDLDLELARPVARFLDVAHVEVVPGADSSAASCAVAGNGSAHQTWMHAWLEPLAVVNADVWSRRRRRSRR